MTSKASKIFAVTLTRLPAEREEIFAARQAAANGVLPAAPDFSKDTHRSYRGKLAAIVAMVEARDVKGLKAEGTQPVSSSRVMLCRYRDNAIAALEFQAKAAKRAKGAAAKAKQRAAKKAA